MLETSLYRKEAAHDHRRKQNKNHKNGGVRDEI